MSSAGMAIANDSASSSRTRNVSENKLRYSELFKSARETLASHASSTVAKELLPTVVKELYVLESELEPELDSAVHMASKNWGCAGGDERVPLTLVPLGS